MAKKKLKAWIWALVGVVILLLAGGIGIYIYLGNVQNTVSAPPGNYIQVPTFYWYECAEAPTDYPPSVLSGSIDQTGITVQCPEFVEQCKIEGISEPNTWTDRQIAYQVCNKLTNTCYQEQYVAFGDTSLKQIINGQEARKVIIYEQLGRDQYLKIKYQKSLILYWSDTSGGRYNVVGQPFVLWKVSFLSGKRIYTTGTIDDAIKQGCRFGSSETPNLLNSVSNMGNIQLNTQLSTSNQKLSFRETRNFIGPTLPMSIENVNFVDINGQKGYCLNRVVYAIGEVVTNSGSYKFVDLSGTANKILSPSVKCCPGEKEPGQICNNNFDWQATTGSQCGAFNSNIDIEPYPSGNNKELIYYTCENGYLVEHRKPAECTSDYDCVGNSNGNICDRKTWTCTSVPNPLCPSTCNSDKDCSNCIGTPTCSKNKCISINQTKTTCTNCWAWAGNFLKSNAGKCIVTDAWKSESFVGKLFGIKVSQDEYCPLVIVIILSVVAIVATIIFVIINNSRKKGKRR